MKEILETAVISGAMVVIIGMLGTIADTSLSTMAVFIVASSVFVNLFYFKAIR